MQYKYLFYNVVLYNFIFYFIFLKTKPDTERVCYSIFKFNSEGTAKLIKLLIQKKTNSI